MKTNSKTSFEVTSDNIFADLGLPDAEESYLKAQLLVAILQRVEALAMTQAEVARATGLTQPNVSLLLNGKLRGFSVERLFSVLNRLGLGVEVRVVHPSPEPTQAATVVKVAANRRTSTQRAVSRPNARRQSSSLPKNYRATQRADSARADSAIKE